MIAKTLEMLNVRRHFVKTLSWIFLLISDLKNEARVKNEIIKIVTKS